MISTKMSSFKEINKLDKIMFILIISLPIFLSISIFFSDLFTSFAGLIFLLTIWKKDNFKFIKILNFEIFIFFLLFLIILISFILSDYKEKALLPSLFYFRYFLLSLIIFYLLKKNPILIKFFLYGLSFSLSFVILDSLIQLTFKSNLFGYPLIGYKPYSPFVVDDSLKYLTSFFNDEKKLGSYLIRFLPLLLCLIYLNNYKNIYLSSLALLFFGFIIFYTSERAALFLYFIFFLFFAFNSNYRIYIFTIFISFMIILFTFNEDLKNKYIRVTLEQTKLIYILSDFDFSKKLLQKINIQKESDPELYDIPRYYSKEHEDLTFTAFYIFKQNIFFGSGIKSFYDKCQDLKKISVGTINTRNNKLTCSTHPHNTYAQILSDIGIFGFLIITIFLIYLIIEITKIFFKKNKNNLDFSFSFITMGLIINMFPLIPSGSFFNNWISLIIYFNLGIWFYIKNKMKTIND